MKEKIYTEKKYGIPMLLFVILLFAATVASFIFFGVRLDAAGEGNENPFDIAMIITTAVVFGLLFMLIPGFKLINPNEALVLTLFGKYKGTLKSPGFYFVNPFCSGYNPAAGTKLRQSDDVSGKKEAAVSGSNDTQ